MSHRESRVSFPALGTTAVVAVEDPAALAAARRAVEDTVAAFDLACSRFREDSELSALNAAAGSELEVGALLMEAVQEALRAARLSDGEVDPTIGQALIALGYDRDFAALGEQPDEAHPAATQDGAAPQRPAPRIASVPGWQAIRLDPERGTIRLPAGVSLDLGATAKGLAADHAAARAHAETGSGVLVSLGGDIAVAGTPPAGGWQVRVTDDHRAGPDAPGQTISIGSGGLATSSTTVRQWSGPHGRAHHLIDPATGRPATVVWRTASVTAGSCVDANIASTAAIIRGERAPAWLASLGLPSRLVSAEGTVRHLAGWPTDGDELPSAPEPIGASA